MFHITRRLLATLPVAAVLIGLAGQPAMLVLPPAMATGLVLLRDRLIRRRVGMAAWPSDGFARHVLVDDLARLICLAVLGLPLFLLGDLLRRILLHP